MLKEFKYIYIVAISGRRQVDAHVMCHGLDVGEELRCMRIIMSYEHL